MLPTRLLSMAFQPAIFIEPRNTFLMDAQSIMDWALTLSSLNTKMTTDFPTINFDGIKIFSSVIPSSQITLTFFQVDKQTNKQANFVFGYSK